MSDGTTAFCAGLDAVSFPKTIDDFSFSERVKNTLDGYKPFMDKSVYRELKIIPGEEVYTDSFLAQLPYQQENVIEPEPEQDVNQDKPADVNIASQSQNVNFISGTCKYDGPTIGGGVVVENNSVIGGACYPPAMDKNFDNHVLTTGRYQRYPAFEKALITIFRKEGRCGTIENDPCGYTCYGIGSSPYCAGIVVKNRAQAEDYYYNNHWIKYKFYLLPDVISGDVFLAGMASGPVTAIKQFKEFLGLTSGKNVIDDNLVNAVKNYNGDIHNRWLDNRDVFLQKVAEKKYHGSVARGYKNAITIKRNNGCHTCPKQTLIYDK